MIDRSCLYNFLLRILCTDPLTSLLGLTYCFAVPFSTLETSVCLPPCHPGGQIWYLVLLIQGLMRG